MNREDARLMALGTMMSILVLVIAGYAIKDIYQYNPEMFKWSIGIIVAYFGLYFFYRSRIFKEDK